jgi:hypothetical protein
MIFLSVNGGGRLQALPLYVSVPLISHSEKRNKNKQTNKQSGEILRLAIWSFNYLDRYATTRYRLLLCSLIHVPNCTYNNMNSARVMRLFIRLPQPSSRARTGSKISPRSDMSMLRTHIVLQKRTYGSKLVVVATHRISPGYCSTTSAVAATDISSV